MKRFFRAFFFTMIIFVAFVFSGCSNRQKKVVASSVPDFSKTTVMENSSGEGKFYKLYGSGLSEYGKADGVLDLVYNKDKSVYVYLKKESSQNSPKKNRIEILYGDSKIELDDFYYAADIKLSPSGDKIAFRTYASSLPESAEGLKVYDLKAKKYVKLKTNVIVSGNLYDWMDDNRILYYGINQKKVNSSNMYEYNTETGIEKTYFDNIDGYCMYFVSIGEDVMYMSGIGDNTSFYYYDSKTKKSRFLDEGISKIYSYSKDKKSGDVFFTAIQKNNVSAVYEFSTKDSALRRITYDFPEWVSVESGISYDDHGHVYFVGGNGESKGDIFVYSTKDDTISLFSNHEAKYKIYGSI